MKLNKSMFFIFTILSMILICLSSVSAVDNNITINDSIISDSEYHTVNPQRIHENCVNDTISKYNNVKNENLSKKYITENKNEENTINKTNTTIKTETKEFNIENTNRIKKEENKNKVENENTEHIDALYNEIKNNTQQKFYINYYIAKNIQTNPYNIIACPENNHNQTKFAPIIAQKTQTIMTLNPTNIKRGYNNTSITGTIKDPYGNNIKGTHKISVKLNDITIGTYITTNGTINNNITIPNTLKNNNYTITVKMGNTNTYYGTNSITSLTINPILTLEKSMIKKVNTNSIEKINYSWYVSTNGTGDGYTYDNPSNLTYVLNKITNDQSIFLRNGIYDYGSPIIINKNISIIGESRNQTILSENKAYRLLTVKSECNVNITNISFINGNAPVGGAIFNEYGSNLTIQDSLFKNNEATYNGGAINNEGNLTIINSIFITNLLRYGSGGAISNEGLLNVQCSVFNDNTASTGGAIDSTGKSILNITNSIFKGNNADDGGAINIDKYSALNITGSIFSYNTAIVGGAINNKGILNAEYNIFIKNLDQNNTEIYNYYSTTNPFNGTIISLNYNWWGYNNTNYQNSPNRLNLTNYNGENLTKWLYFNTTSSTDIWTYNTSVMIMANLNQYYDNSNSNIDTLRENEITKLPQNVTVNFTTPTGSIISKTTLNNATAMVIYKPFTIGENKICSTLYTTNSSLIKTVYPIDTNINVTIEPGTTTTKTVFNITIKDLNKNNVTQGIVYFYNNNVLLGDTLVNNGIANYQYSFNKTGNYIITIKYTDTTYNNSYTNVNFTILRTNTYLFVNPIIGMVENTIILQANITDNNGNNINEGNVIFKINGTTIKDNNGNPLYTQVNEGISTIKYIIPYSLTKDNLIIQAIYSGTTEKYNPSQNINTINVTKRTATLNLTIDKNIVKTNDILTFVTIVQDTNGTFKNNGQIIFKFQGHTITDINGNTIILNMTNKTAKLEYTIPTGISAKTYNITAIYSNKDYNRVETTIPLTVEKTPTIMTLNTSYTTRGSNTTQIIGIIKDINGNNIIGTHKISVKLNGKSIGTYKLTNGIINTNITLPDTLRNTNYNITIKIGDTNAYKGTSAITTLIIKPKISLNESISLI